MNNWTKRFILMQVFSFYFVGSTLTSVFSLFYLRYKSHYFIINIIYEEYFIKQNNRLI